MDDAETINRATETTIDQSGDRSMEKRVSK